MYETVEQFVAAVGGRNEVQRRLGMSKQTISQYCRSNELPPAYFVACEALAIEKSVPALDRSFFTFKSVLPRVVGSDAIQEAS